MKSGRIAAFLVLIALLGMTLLWVAFSRNGGRELDVNAPREYTYGKTIANNGMVLHYLRTRPSNAVPAFVNNNLVLTSSYGINGGFFFQKELLSIAVLNDVPVNQSEGTYGDGNSNVKYARGTLVWDGSTDTLSVQVVSLASELKVADRSHYWAQGGISMGLSLGDGWQLQAAAEHAPFANEERLRSAAVYDTAGDLILVVSSTPGTLASFRKAIVERFGPNGLVDGIFLDGDGSSQLRSREAELRGDGRPVLQMLRLLE